MCSHFSRSIVKRFAFEVDSQYSWAQRKWVMVLHLSWESWIVELKPLIWCWISLECGKSAFHFQSVSNRKIRRCFSMMQKTGDFFVWEKISWFMIESLCKKEMRRKPKKNTSVKRFVRVKVKQTQVSHMRAWLA